MPAVLSELPKSFLNIIKTATTGRVIISISLKTLSEAIILSIAPTHEPNKAAAAETRAAFICIFPLLKNVHAEKNVPNIEEHLFVPVAICGGMPAAI